MKLYQIFYGLVIFFLWASKICFIGSSSTEFVETLKTPGNDQKDTIIEKTHQVVSSYIHICTVYIPQVSFN